MKIQNELAWIFIGLAAISACKETGKIRVDGNSCEDMRRILKEMIPTQEARRNVIRGDLRFLATDGYSRQFPGVYNYGLVTKNGYRVLKKTTEAIEHESCIPYQAEAFDFAERYNREVLKQTRVSDSENLLSGMRHQQRH